LERVSGFCNRTIQTYTQIDADTLLQVAIGLSKKLIGAEVLRCRTYGRCLFEISGSPVIASVDSR
jgi:hypothetical protein